MQNPPRPYFDFIFVANLRRAGRTVATFEYAGRLDEPFTRPRTTWWAI